MGAMELGTDDPFVAYSMFVWIQRAVSLLIYGVLVVLGLVWGTRSGGFLAAAALVVLFGGSVAAALLTPTLGTWVVGVPNVVGLAMLLGAVFWNVQRHRRAAVEEA